MHLSHNSAGPLGLNVYLVGSNLCNSFVVGAIGSDTDFFMIAAQPRKDSNYPLITGNFLDSEGNVLFKLVQNELIINPGHCSKILSDRVGYEIHDSDDNLILKVATLFRPMSGHERWVTTIEGNFFNRNRDLVLEANGDVGYIETSIGCAMGFNGTTFTWNMGLTPEQTQTAAIALLSGGKIFEQISGLHEDEDIELDGKILMPGTIIRNCRLKIVTGDFKLLGDGEMNGNKLDLQGPAWWIGRLVASGFPQPGEQQDENPPDENPPEENPPVDNIH